MTRSWQTALLMCVIAIGGCFSGSAAPEQAEDDAGQDAGTDEEVRSGELPCPVETVLRSRCQECHGDPTVHSAPFSLVTYADTQADYFGKPVWVRMQNAVDAGFMPPIPKPPLSDTDKATMLDWLGRGAPPAEASEVCP